MALETETDCRYYGACSGCGYTFSQINIEKQTKLHTLDQLTSEWPHRPQIKYQNFSVYERDRLDFVVENGNVGLWSDKQKQIVDLPHCQLLHPQLMDYLDKFRKIKWPVKKGSFRLRRGWQGISGAWLDFSNLDIKSLLESQTELRELLSISTHVEIGQKHKSLVSDAANTELKLKDPQFFPWWCSIHGGNSVPLFCTVGDFTQPSQFANHWILEKMQSWFSEIKPNTVIELGAGIGNMTVALAPLAKSYTAIENNPSNIKSLTENMNRYHSPSFELLEKNFHQEGSYAPSDLILANPARSGLGSGMESILKNPPSNFIYMSCFPETWAADCQQLIQQGYQAQELWVVNQFPLTQHFEVLSLFKKI
ncbi:MAG: rRNA adenine N-6-methyltransferase family protein [Bdellovibrionota bacterium]